MLILTKMVVISHGFVALEKKEAESHGCQDCGKPHDFFTPRWTKMAASHMVVRSLPKMAASYSPSIWACLAHPPFLNKSWILIICMGYYRKLRLFIHPLEIPLYNLTNLKIQKAKLSTKALQIIKSGEFRVAICNPYVK